ncbi:MAG: undecaprenyl-phosphate glucose phosphotransferase [Burkholderiales bacterium]
MARSVLKPHAALFAATLRICDPVLTVATGIVAYRAYLGTWSPPDHYLLFLAVGALAVATVFPMFNLYEPQRGAGLADEMRRLLFAWLLLAALTGGTIFATKMGDGYSRVWVSAWLAGGFVLTTALRLTVRLGLRALRLRGLNQRHVVIVGAGELGRTVAARLASSPWAGFHVLAFYDDDPQGGGESVAGCLVWSIDDRLAADVAAGTIDQVWIALPLRAEERIREILTMLREYPVEIRFVPDIYSFHLINHSMTEVAGLPVISLTETPMSGVNRIVKAIEDYTLATLLVVAASPLMLLIAIGVRLSSPGPVLYRQQRVTWNGEQFEMLKFRTMPVDAEAASGPVWSRHGERRATPFGALLRRTSLDELPQLFNVLEGQMSLVGPRPERPEFVERFRSQIPGYMQKHLVKAGITGWAQVNDLRGDSDLAQRIQYDLYYIDNWSLWFDLRILVLTLWHILKSHNAR